MTASASVALAGEVVTTAGASAALAGAVVATAGASTAFADALGRFMYALLGGQKQ